MGDSLLVVLAGLSGPGPSRYRSSASQISGLSLEIFFPLTSDRRGRTRSGSDLGRAATPTPGTRLGDLRACTARSSICSGGTRLRTCCERRGKSLLSSPGDDDRCRTD